MTEVVEPAPGRSSEEALAASAQKSKAAWRRAGLRLQSISPSALARLALVGGAVAVVGWLLTRSFVPLVPFAIGLVLAYICAPIVEALDRVMPRGLAVLLVMLGELLLMAFIVAALVVPMIREGAQLVQSVPGPEQLRESIDKLAGALTVLPTPVQTAIRSGLQDVAAKLRDSSAAVLQSLPQLGVGLLLGLIRTFGFLIGLLVLPTWIYSVLADQKRGRRVLDRVLPERAKADFWAVVRIFDLTLSASLRGLVLEGIAVGATTFVVLSLVERIAGVSFEYKVMAAVLAGLMELIPDIGPFLWAIPVGLVGLLYSPQVAVGVVGGYIAGRWLVHRLLVSRIEKKVVRGIHPAVLVVAIVALSQFGLVWLFLAAPIVSIVRDLFRYAYGRLSDPPRPAGLLPDEPLPAAPLPVTSVPARQAARRRQGRQAPVGGGTPTSAG